MEVDSSIVPVSSTEDYTDYQASEPASGMRSLSLGPYLSLPLSRLSGQSDPVTFSPLPSFHFEDFTAGFSNDDSLPASFAFSLLKSFLRRRRRASQVCPFRWRSCLPSTLHTTTPFYLPSLLRPRRKSRLSPAFFLVE